MRLGPKSTWLRRRGLRVSVIINIVAALVVAHALKSHYSAANCAQLSWMLEPLATTVGFVSGLTFEPRPGLGYASADGSVVIVKSCGGINFLIIAFCVTVATFIFRVRSWWAVALIPASLVAAYLLALCVNALRILVAIQLHERHVHWGWFTPDRIHVMAGILIYFVSLCAYHQAISIRRDGATIWIPLVCYLAITVLAPILNGAYRLGGDRFLEYCLLTMFIPAILTVAAKWMTLTTPRLMKR